jgi:hypothetical protein
MKIALSEDPVKLLTNEENLIILVLSNDTMFY